jgi:hypothetical protein
LRGISGPGQPDPLARRFAREGQTMTLLPDYLTYCGNLAAMLLALLFVLEVEAFWPLSFSGLELSIFFSCWHLKY